MVLREIAGKGDKHWGLGGLVRGQACMDSLSSEDLKLTKKKNLLPLSLKFDNDLESVPSPT